MKLHLDEIRDFVTTNGLSFTEGLLKLSSYEVDFKEQNASRSMIKAAAFPFVKELKDYEFEFQPSVNEQEMRELASLGFLEKNENIVFLGPSCVFTNVVNPRSAVSRKDQYLKTYVGKGASIGANATIVCGHTIGEYAMIGAGAVVTKDIPPYALVVGNPSHRIGWVSEYGHRLSFNEKGIATCPESNQQYQLRGDIVTRIS